MDLLVEQELHKLLQFMLALEARNDGMELVANFTGFFTIPNLLGHNELFLDGMMGRRSNASFRLDNNNGGL
jgi:hypothetical protein